MVSNKHVGVLTTRSALVGGEMTDLTWREAAGAAVGDLEHVCPCQRKTSGVAYRKLCMTEGKRCDLYLCSSQHRLPQPQAGTHSSNCKQQLLFGDTH
jgi:hypothetical protein